MANPSTRPRILITGADGFVGRRLVRALESDGAASIFAPPGPGVAGSLDVADEEAVSATIQDVAPDVVVHLAAIAAVTDSLKDPRLTWRVNLKGVLNVVLALQAHAPRAHLLFVSSAEVYGASLSGDRAADEQTLLQPVNPYAASKAAADILVRQAAAGGLASTVVRPFNHIGPGQAEAFVVPSFAAQIARIEAGLQPPVMLVGSLDDERDFLDVDDVAACYRLLVTLRAQLPPGAVFNVASGVPTRIGDVLDHLLSRSRAKIEVKVDPERLRPMAVPRIVGDASRLRALGWAPTMPLTDTLDRVLEDMRRQIRDRTA